MSFDARRVVLYLLAVGKWPAGHPLGILLPRVDDPQTLLAAVIGDGSCPVCGHPEVVARTGSTHPLYRVGFVRHLDCSVDLFIDTMKFFRDRRHDL